jgi:hypothetical protein
VTGLSRGLPLKAAYSITELSRVSGIERRTLKRVLSQAGVQLVGSGRILYVSLSELELKLHPLWEGIKAAHALATRGTQAR